MAKAFDLESVRNDVGGNSERAQSPDFGDYILPKTGYAAAAASGSENVDPLVWTANVAHVTGRTVGYGMATIRHFGVEHPMIKGTNGLSAAGIGAAISVGDYAIDRFLFPNVERKTPSIIADMASVAVMFTPQPFALKTGEALAMHAVGKYLDSKL